MFWLPRYQDTRFNGSICAHKAGVNFVEKVHGRYVHRRRVDVLSRHIAEMLPPEAVVLDVGCGDGRLARLVQERRKDITISGLDVLVRPQTEIRVRQFDGRNLPLDSGSVDVVMFIDVLHHTEDPMILLREAQRVARKGVLIKDHVVKGLLAWSTLRFMDRVGNRRHGVALPHNYWTQSQWTRAFSQLGLAFETWKSRLGLYPAPANLIFERALHFLTYLRPASVPQYAGQAELARTA